MWKGPVRCGSCYPALVVLGPIRSQVCGQTEQAMGNKAVSGTPLWPLRQLLSPGSCPIWDPALPSFSGEQRRVSMSQTNPSLPDLLWSWCFVAVIETLTRTVF